MLRAEPRMGCIMFAARWHQLLNDNGTQSVGYVITFTRYRLGEFTRRWSGMTLRWCESHLTRNSCSSKRKSENVKTQQKQNSLTYYLISDQPHFSAPQVSLTLLFPDFQYMGVMSRLSTFFVYNLSQATHNVAF